MDIALAVTTFDRSEGTGGYTVELAQRVAAVHTLTLYANTVATAPPDGVRVIHVPALRGSASLLNISFPYAFSALRRRHDVVHAQGWTALSADVVTAHYVMAAWRVAARTASVPSALGERVFGALVARREGALFRRCGTVIAPSRGVAMDLANHYGRTAGVHVIPHGFPTLPAPPPRVEARRRFNLPAAAVVALYVGDARKGLDAALQAVAETPEVILLVVTRSVRARYDMRLDALRIGHRVYWAGYLPDPSPAYAAADLLLYPTIYDPFGLVISEAMAHGLPAIVTRAAGAAELIEHRTSGWLLDTSAGAEAAAALHVVAGDAALRSRLSAGARAVAARRSWDDVARETLAVYEQAVGLTSGNR